MRCQYFFFAFMEDCTAQSLKELFEFHMLSRAAAVPTGPMNYRSVMKWGQYWI